jgi:hypothetical protein
MELARKLAILADAAKYDASCASSGTTKRNSRASGGLGLPFVVTADHNAAALSLDGDQLANRVAPANRQLDLFQASASAITGQL